jgi:hypothetical protein
MLFEDELNGLGQMEARNGSLRGQKGRKEQPAQHRAQLSFRVGAFRKNVISTFHGIPLA